MNSVVEVTQDGAVRALSIDNPPVNGLAAAVRSALADELAKALADDGVEAIVIAGKGKLFCAGADIREFGQPPNSRRRGAHGDEYVAGRVARRVCVPIRSSRRRGRLG